MLFKKKNQYTEHTELKLLFSFIQTQTKLKQIEQIGLQDDFLYFCIWETRVWLLEVMFNRFEERNYLKSHTTYLQD